MRTQERERERVVKNYRNNVIDRIDEVRNALGKSVNDFVRPLGLSRAIYYYYLSGKYFPALESLVRMQEAYDIPVEYFFSGDKSLLSAEMRRKMKKYQSE